MEWDRDWHTTDEVARALGVSSQTVRRWIAERLLRAEVIHAGGRNTYRVRAGDLADFRRRHVADSWDDDWE
jgi:excisionase family DNA binding protein